MISIFISWKWSRCVNALADKRCATFVYPTKLFFGWHGWFVPLADRAMPDTINYVRVYAWPPIGTTKGA